MEVAKERNRIWSKILMAMLSVALVFTMMPLAGGVAYAAEGQPDQQGWNPEDVALIVNTDGNTSIVELKIADIKDLTSVSVKSTDNKDLVGVKLGTIIDKYSVKKQKVTIDAVDQEYYNSRLVLSKDEAREYVLVYKEGENDVFGKSKKAPEGKYIYGCLNLYKPDGELYTREQKLTGVITAGAPAVDPSTLIKTITITGNAVKSEKVYADLNEMRNDPSVSAKVKEDVVFNWKNSEESTGTVKVTGITIADLIDIAGVKENMEVKEIKVDTQDGQWQWTYSADTLLKPDMDGNLAMFAWTYWISDKDQTSTDQQRTVVGQFKAGEMNQPSWGKMVCKFEVIGEEKASEPAVQDGQQAAVSGNTYTVTSAAAGTAALTKAKNAKKVNVPDTVAINGKTLKVTKVNANAFTGKKIRTVTLGKNVDTIAKYAFKKSKARTLIVKTKALTKKSVKGSLKKSKIKRVKVKVGSKKENKKYVKKYRKIFKKKNSGKRVKVRR